MNKKLKLKIISAMAILLAFACLISAGWVIAQSVQTTDANKKEAPKSNQPALQTPQNTPKFFGTIGRPDPFIPVKAVGGKSAQKATGLSGQSGQSGTSKTSSSEESQSGASLSGTFITNGSRYALIRLGDQNYIVKEGETKLGFKVVKIASKSVTLTGKSGTVNLKVEDYSSASNQAPAQTEPLSGSDTKSLVPPPMQPPVPAQTESSTNTDVKPTNVQPEKSAK